MASAVLGKIVIPISETLYNTYNTTHNQGLFDDSGNLVLMIAPGDYRLVKTYGMGSLITGMASYTYKLESPVKTIEITLKENRIALKYILESLIETALTDPAIYEPIEVRDYLMPESGDVGSYSTRYCVMRFDVKEGLFIGSDNIPYVGGYSLVLEQIS